jgi:5-methylcytosine-specific restriction endonuclease McrA
MRKRRQEHYARNRDQVLATNRVWHQNNRVAVRLRKRREYVADPERVRARQHVWATRNRAAVRLRVQLQYHRRKGGALVVEYGEILLGDPCSYCGAPAEHIDHIDPLARGGSPDWDNLTAACASCNTSKQARPLLGFLLDRLDEAHARASRKG